MSEWADVFGGQLRVTTMPAEQFDELVDSLDVPDETPNLERAFKRERSFTQRS